jgi:hypothetical protein
LPGRWTQRYLLVRETISLNRDRSGSHRNHLVQRGDPMAGTHLAGVFPVVVEIFLGEQPVLVAEQAVGLHFRRIELDLDLYVLGHGEQGSSEFTDEYLLRFTEAVDIGIVPIPLVRHLLHLGVLQIPGTEAKHREESSLFPPRLDQPDHLCIRADPHIEVAVGGKDEPVVPFGQVILASDVVGQLEPGATSSGSTRLEPVDSGENRRLVLARGGRKHETRGAGVHHNGHPVLRAQLLDQGAKRLLH